MFGFEERGKVISRKISVTKEAICYYDSLCNILRIREFGVPEVFRYYLERNGYENAERIIVIGDNVCFLRLAETIAEDDNVSVTLLCDISKKEKFPLNGLDYCFGIIYLDLKSDDVKKIVNNAVVLSDRRHLDCEINYLDIHTHLYNIGKLNVMTRTALNKVYHYFNSRGINVLYAQVPTISPLSPESNRHSFDELDATEIEKMFNFPGGGREYYLELKRCIVQTMPPIRKGKKLEFSDFHSSLINRIHGERCIISSPPKYDYTLWILGQCTADSTHTDDMHTIGNVLQEMLLCSNDLQSIPRVRTVGMPAVEFIKAINNWYTLEISAGDVVIILSPDRFLDAWDISTEQELSEAGEYICYGDYEHCNHKGYRIYAECIYNFLTDDSHSKSLNNFYKEQHGISKKISYSKPVKEDDQNIPVFMGNRELLQYKEGLKRYKQQLAEGSRSGSIVMNCNPFTLGHRYLIETALKQVDWLYIFVVEEDKSENSFEDRIRLVREGTKDLECVTIIPSGKFIISSITFPRYFTKGASPNVKIDTSVDVEVFAQHIAPVLDIVIRFVGEEPMDNVTRQYNEMLADILPKYGIDVKIIKRKVDNEGNIISASRVREAYALENWELIEKMVPECTIEFLKSKNVARKNF